MVYSNVRTGLVFLILECAMVNKIVWMDLMKCTVIMSVYTNGVGKQVSVSI